MLPGIAYGALDALFGGPWALPRQIKLSLQHHFGQQKKSQEMKYM
jgi:hypothetical protein